MVAFNTVGGWLPDARPPFYDARHLHPMVTTCIVNLLAVLTVSQCIAATVAATVATVALIRCCSAACRNHIHPYDLCGCNWLTIRTVAETMQRPSRQSHRVFRQLLCILNYLLHYSFTWINWIFEKIIEIKNGILTVHNTLQLVSSSCKRVSQGLCYANKLKSVKCVQFLCGTLTWCMHCMQNAIRIFNELSDSDNYVIADC